MHIHFRSGSTREGTCFLQSWAGSSELLRRPTAGAAPLGSTLSAGPLPSATVLGAVVDLVLPARTVTVATFC